MILSFKEYFISKIKLGVTDVVSNSFRPTAQEVIKSLDEFYCLDGQPKYHTLRQDKNDRFKKGVALQFWVGNPRNKNSNINIRQFGTGEVISFQWVRFFWAKNEFEKTNLFPHIVPTYRNEHGYLYVMMGSSNVNKIYLDDSSTFVLNENHLYRLARYDGFESIEELLSFFNYEEGTYKLIHWTNDVYSPSEASYHENDQYHNYHKLD